MEITDEGLTLKNRDIALIIRCERCTATSSYRREGMTTREALRYFESKGWTKGTTTRLEQTQGWYRILCKTCAPAAIETLDGEDEPPAPWPDPRGLLEAFNAGTPEEQQHVLIAAANLAHTAQQLIDSIKGSHDTDH